MKLRTILLSATVGTAVVGAVLAGTSAPAGAAPSTPTAHPVAQVSATKAGATGLVSRSGALLTSHAASTTASTATSPAKVHGHDGYVPPSLAPHPSAARPHSVIGADNRYRVTATTSYPSSAIALIEHNGAQWCTGWMISKDTLLTAGHCVTDGHGTWYSGLTFLPGSNGGTAPFGTCASRGTYAFSAWANSADTNYDTAIIKLNCTVGYSTGWFGTWWQSASPNGLSATVEGYPGDKPFGTEWIAYDSIRASDTDRLYYQDDTAPGESGSPIFQYRYNQSFCNGYCAMGVHTNGSNGTNNSGTRFTQNKLASIYNVVGLP